MSGTKYDAIIVGAGLSGLSAAVWLKRIGYNILIIEKSDDIGGKLRSDFVDGFTLDRGFQVFLTAYPEAKRILQYNELGLKDFSPGAVLLHRGKKVVLHDPFKNPSKMPKMLFFKLATIGDKFRLLQLRMRLNRMTYSDIFEQYEAKTSTVLTKKKFSKKFIQSFVKPFFSGIFLENSLETSRRMFEFVFKMMSEGSIAQPENGIAAIAKQLGSELAEGSIRLNTEVAKINNGKVELSTGEVIEGRNIIVATDAHAPFLEEFRMSRKFEYVGGTTLYFSTDIAPAKHKMIMLNTASDKLANLVVVMSNINPALAPNGKHLIAVSINGIPSVSDNILEEGVKNELKAYFDTAQWNLLRIYRINHALPKQNSVLGDIMPARFILKDGVYICGDYLLNGSQNAALRMGRKVAQRIMKDERSGLKKNRKKKKYSKFFEKE